MKRIAGLILATLLAPQAAWAIVGGTENAGPLSKSGAMLVSRSGMCSAVVVAPDVLLTAAHCVAGNREYRIFFRDAVGEPTLVEPQNKAVHPGYSAKAVEERKRSIDLALVRVSEPLPDRFEPATLSATAPSKGAGITAGGFGVAAESDARSTGTFRTADLTVIEPYGPSRILLWTEGKNTGACEGDSGGPMVSGENVVAITGWSAASSGRGCGGLTQGTLLGPQREWIDRTLESWGRSARWR